MFAFNSFEDILRFALAAVIAYVFFVYINGFLDYHFGAGAREERKDAISRITAHTIYLVVTVLIWYGYFYIRSII